MGTEKVESLLKSYGINYRLIPLSGRSVSYEEVVKNIQADINPKDICKTIITKGTRASYAFLLEGESRIDFNRATKVVDEGKLSILGEDELRRLIGQEPGAVCPLTLEGIDLYVDQRVLRHKKINFGSGDINFGLEIDSRDLRYVVKYKIVDVSEKRVLS